MNTTIERLDRQFKSLIIRIKKHYFAGWMYSVRPQNAVFNIVETENEFSDAIGHT